MSGQSNILLSYGAAAAGNGLLTGLVSYYKFDESSGTIIDAHGAYDGTNNGATYGATGIINNCLDFDGSNDYVNLGNINEMEGTNTITVSCWRKRDLTTGPTSGEGLVAKFNGGTSWLLQDRRSITRTQFHVYISNTSYAAYANVASYDTNWHHLVGRYNGSEVSLWIDGVKQTATVSITGNIDNDNANVTVGSYQLNNDYFNGLIDEIGLWDVALTDTQIGQLYNSGSGLAYSSFTS